MDISVKMMAIDTPNNKRKASSSEDVSETEFSDDGKSSWEKSLIEADNVIQARMDELLSISRAERHLSHLDSPDDDGATAKNRRVLSVALANDRFKIESPMLQASRTAVRELMSDKAELEMKFQKSEVKCYSLAAAEAKSLAEITDLNRARLNHQAVITHQKNEMEALQQELNSSEKQRGLLREARNEKDRKCQEKDQEIAGLRGNIQKLKQEMALDRGRIEGSLARIRQDSTEIELLKSSMEEKQKSNDDLTNKLKEAENTIQELNNRIEELQEEAAEDAYEFIVMGEESDTLRDSSDSKDKKITELEATIEDLKVEAENLRENLETKDRCLRLQNKCVEDNEILRLKLTDAHARMDDMLRDNMEDEQEIRSLSRDVEKMDKDIFDYEDKIDALRDDLKYPIIDMKEMKNKIERQNAELDEWEDAYATAEAEIQDLQTSYRYWYRESQELQWLRTEFQNQRDELFIKRQELSIRDNSIERMDDEYRVLQDENHAQQVALNDSQKDATELKRQLACFEKELARSKEEMEENRNYIEQLQGYLGKAERMGWNEKLWEQSQERIRDLETRIERMKGLSTQMDEELFVQDEQGSGNQA